MDTMRVVPKGDRPMKRTPWPPPSQNRLSPAEPIRPAAQEHAGHPSRRQDGGADEREAYYVHHLSRAVQHYHQRLYTTYR
jgi:hypothetical protein